MRTTIVPASLLAIFLSTLAGCRSVVAPRTPQIRTIASIGDRPQSSGAGEPGNSVSTDPEASARSDDEDRQISGRVVDDRGNPVPNARVRIALDGSGAGRVVRASTDEAGRFTLHNLRQDAEYTLIAEDQAGAAEGRTSAATADRRVRITLKGGSRVQSVSESGPEAGTSEDDEPTSGGNPSIPPPPPPPPVGSSGVRDRSTSRASTGRSVAWRGSGSRSNPAREGSEEGSDLGRGGVREELVAEPAPKLSEDLAASSPGTRPTDRDELPAPKSSPIPPVEPAPKQEMPAPPASLPTPEPDPIGSAPTPRVDPTPSPTPSEPANPEPLAEPKPVESPGPSPFVPESTGPSPPRNDEKPQEPGPPQPLETPSPVPEPPASAAPAPAPSLEPPPASVPPAEAAGSDVPKPEEKGPSPEPDKVEAIEPPPSAPPPANPDPAASEPPKTAEAAANPALRRPTWGEITPRKPPQLAVNTAPSGRRRLFSPSQPAAKPGPVDGAAEQPTVSCQYDPKTKRLVNFRLPDLQGNPVELSGFDADFVLIDFWGTWCGPCLDSIPHLVQLQKKYGDRLQVVGIAYEEGDAVEQAKKVQAAAKKLGINYTVLLGGADGKPCPVQSALHVQVYPTMVLLDRQGRILFQAEGSTPQKLARLDYIVNARAGGSNIVRR